jgi:hypothetical protein
LSSAFNSEALTAQTTHVINGSAPYLTFDGGVTRATNVDELLAITLPDGGSGVKLTPSTPSSFSNPIEMPIPNVRFSDISMFVPTNTNSVTLSSLIGPPNNYWGDDDGDGNVSVTGGNITLAITDKEGNSVTRSETLDICKSPYKVKLESTAGTLSTSYGEPNSSTFAAGDVEYYLKPNSPPKVCFARPNLFFGTDVLAGPPAIWNPDKGFLVQSEVPSSYGLNFPTTGANNLYFDLDIAGVDARTLSWPNITHGDITVELNPTSATTVRATLVGPSATSSQIDSDTPTPVAVPNLSSPFEIVGRDSSSNQVITYGFKLKQWFVNRGDKMAIPSNQATWCSSIGYNLSRVRDLTNAIGTIGLNGDPILGASPSSSGGYHMRHIDAGFFTEWGEMYDYTGAGFFDIFHDGSGNGDYLTSDVGAAGEREHFMVSPNIGQTGEFNGDFLCYAVCASVLRP